ncbi:dephospho-CoA kinase [Sphingosinicella sp. LHD-64]|uniref:dephospho-CoA kinase n=1 Tax=Sphingosinicella sp. LHD-64 TaxID=3072139 RepID=UPI00280DC540|nr:dephospho-CoA kinase [Sphingosinicella sp. LHD-64]MDQ8757022.1 dephospho-CoA kinase [Sphingosinicella sp. LHD-64]
MIVLGLTGSIGMGKSTVARMFADEGVPVFDADKAVRRLQGPEGALVTAIEAAFPGSTGPDGVKRDVLAERVLTDRSILKQLEAIVHPAVGEARQAFLAEHANALLVVLDVPLLFETGGDAHVDKVAVVSADADVQRIRTLARPDMTPEKFARILIHQMPDAEKRKRADFVIPTDVDIEETREAVRRIIACLRTDGDS